MCVSAFSYTSYSALYWSINSFDDDDYNHDYDDAYSGIDGCGGGGDGDVIAMVKTMIIVVAT